MATKRELLHQSWEVPVLHKLITEVTSSYRGDILPCVVRDQIRCVTGNEQPAIFGNYLMWLNPYVKEAGLGGAISHRYLIPLPVLSSLGLASLKFYDSKVAPENNQEHVSCRKGEKNSCHGLKLHVQLDSRRMACLLSE